MLLMICILALSFLNVTFTAGILAGFPQAVYANLVDNSTSDVVINPQQYPTVRTYIPDQARLRAEIQTIPGVEATTREYLLASSVAFDKYHDGQYVTTSGEVYGVDPSDVNTVLSFKKDLIAGQFLSPSDTDQILLGVGVAGGGKYPQPADLGGVKVGDKVRVTYSNGDIRTYTVKGIYSILLGNLGDSAIITSREAESELGVHDEASQILVKTNLQYASVDQYAAKIRALFPNLKVQTYKQLLAVVAPVIAAFNLISYIVSAISILIAAVIIFVLIYINAVNRRRQIGILKAIGLRQSIIVLSYVFQSLFYMTVGSIIGAGLAFGVVTPFMDAHPIVLPIGVLYPVYVPVTIAISTLMLVAASMLAGYFPSKLVARENILTAIDR